MEKLGLVGGTGPESTLMYYNELNYGYQKRLGIDNSFPKLTIESINIYEMLTSIEKNDLAETVNILVKAINNLYRAGATYASFTAITPHIVFDEVAQQSPIPLINMLELVAEKCVSQNYKRPLLLGTSFTMTRSFFIETLRKYDIDVVLPDQNNLLFVARKIMDELEKGIFKSETKEQFVKLIEEQQTVNQIDSVILGCTELPLLLNQDDTSVPLLNPVELHIEKILDNLTSNQQ